MGEHPFIRPRYRLRYHIMAPYGWLNDPNGLIEFKGNYHVFYQHYPYAAEWGAMHWGHAVSRDLIHWKHLPAALSPDPAYESGCFSGSAVEHDGALTLIYTSHDENRSPKEMQSIAESADGIHFTKFSGNPVIRTLPEEASEDFRDPKVWREDGLWHMVLGSCKNGRARALLFESEDLRGWKYAGILFESDGTLGDMWECPDFFPLGDRYVLVVSPMHKPGSRNLYIVGHYDKPHHRFIPEKIREVDFGFDLYACQTFQDHLGRRILIAWMNQWNSAFPTKEDGWAGALTLPRELKLDGTDIRALPIKEIDRLRGRHLAHRQMFRLEPAMRRVLPEISGKWIELCLRVRFDDPACQTFGLHLRASEDRSEKTTLLCDLSEGTLSLDTTHAGLGNAEISSAPRAGDRELSLRIFIDTSSVEVFADGGRLTLTDRIYPQDSSVFYDLFCTKGNCLVEKLDAWEMKSGWEQTHGN